MVIKPDGALPYFSSQLGQLTGKPLPTNLASKVINKNAWNTLKKETSKNCCTVNGEVTKLIMKKLYDNSLEV